MIELFKNAADCCACGACVNACPKEAIDMTADKYGYVYPSINQDKCIECGICKKVCNYQCSNLKDKSPTVYGAVVKDNSILMKSASGGVFALMAAEILSEGGVVFGAALVFETGKLNAKHIYIEHSEDLHMLQGSKYVRSSIEDTYRSAKKFLSLGRKVLFSGTPCQIDGLYGFLGTTYENLYTIDVICHGVPSGKMFHDYIMYYEKKYGKKIVDYKFRDKKKGNGLLQCFIFDDGAKRFKDAELLGYTYEFLKSNTYRENCYQCKYADKNRVADITLGDFWGIEKEHPAFYNKYAKNGVSCVLVNTDKGNDLWLKVRVCTDYLSTDIEKVAKHNKQLVSCSELSPKRQQLLDWYYKEGYAGLNKFYMKDINKKYLYYLIKYHIPKPIKNSIKKIKECLM